MATSVAKRVTSPPAESTTGRVTTSDAVVASSAGDTWRGSWGGLTTRGNSWRQSWMKIVAGSAASPAIAIASRVSGAITETTTKMITGPVTETSAERVTTEPTANSTKRIT